jgi:hypothetical protein
MTFISCQKLDGEAVAHALLLINANTVQSKLFVFSAIGQTTDIFWSAQLLTVNAGHNSSYCLWHSSKLGVSPLLQDYCVNTVPGVIGPI